MCWAGANQSAAGAASPSSPPVASLFFSCLPCSPCRIRMRVREGRKSFFGRCAIFSRDRDADMIQVDSSRRGQPQRLKASTITPVTPSRPPDHPHRPHRLLPRPAQATLAFVIGPRAPDLATSPISACWVPPQPVIRLLAQVFARLALPSACSPTLQPPAFLACPACPSATARPAVPRCKTWWTAVDPRHRMEAL
jgi:hypothetical protein